MIIQPAYNMALPKNTMTTTCIICFSRLVLLIIFIVDTAEVAFAFSMETRGGGRTPSQPDKIDPSEDWTVDPTQPSECRLIICQITDVYTLEHLASFKTMVQDIKAKAGESTKVLSMLTGDFLSPYLLSSVDRGVGMMNALSKIPLDILTWGNL